MRIDREQDMPFDFSSGIKYITTHTRALNSFTSKFKSIDKVDIIRQFLAEDPALLASLLKINFDTTEYLRIDNILHEITREGTFTIMFGLPRHGKTASAVWVIEEIHKRYPNMKIYWFGYSPALKKAYPFVIQTFNLKEISGNDKNGKYVGAFLVYDEMLLSLMGRDALSTEVKERIRSFPTAGHSGYAVVGLSQSTRVDPMFKDLLTYIWFKPFVVNSMFEKTMAFRSYVRYLIPHRKSENLIYNMTSNKSFMFSNTLPLEWNDNISKAFSPIENMSEQIEYANMLMEAGIKDRDLRTFLNQRNVNIDKIAQYMDEGLQQCPVCASIDYIRQGRDKDGIQKRKCKVCNKIYLEESK